MTSVGEYLHHVGLEAYMKQFLTFKLMKALYPENILLLTYESLVRNPKATFLSVLNHFGHDIGNPVHLTTMEKALTLSSQKSMKQIENLVGHALADDQIERNGSHIRDGSTGQWKALLNSDDLGKIQQRLEDFGLSLADFEVE